MSDRHAGVIVRPPILYGVAVLAAMWLQRVRPWDLLPDDVARGVAIVSGVLGLGLFASCLVQFVRHRTTVSTHRTSSSLITNGPFRFSRNPIYVALTLFYLGWVGHANNAWGLIFLVPVLVVMQKGVIEREERFLSQLFGDEYLHYTRRVRRWL